MIHGADDRVVERGGTASVDAFKSFLEFGDAAGEILVEIEVVVVIEIDDEGLVLGIGSLDQSEGGFVDASALVAHGAAVVNNQAHADRNVFTLEYGKFLFGFVFKDAEIFLLEAVDEFAAVVEDGGVENDEADVDSEDAALLVVLARWGRLGSGEREGVVLGEG